MAEDFQASNLWKTSRSGSFEGGSPAVSSISGTTSIADVTGRGRFNWSAGQFAEAKDRHGEELAGPIPNSCTTTDGIPFMDSTLQLSSFGLSTPSMDWSQTLLSCSERADSSFQAMLQEDLSSRPSSTFFRQEPEAMDPRESSRIPIKDMSQPNFLLENSLSGDGGFPITSSSSYGGCSPAPPMLQGLFESVDTRTQQPFFVDSQQMVDYQSQMLAYRSVSNEMQQLLKAFPQQQQQQQSATNQLQFTNNTQFWNASGSSSQLGVQPFDPKPVGSSNLTMKISEGVREKKTSSEPAMKKIRLETPSSLPTFKVRKEKLGDRITSLQQLVSPFGKTDTASVLHEAIEYIKFLHEQVSVLSTPYLKNGHPVQQQQQHSIDKSKDGEGTKQDLRSRGLCLVPIASTYPVASETTADFWTPTFGGTYR